MACGRLPTYVLERPIMSITRFCLDAYEAIGSHYKTTHCVFVFPPTLAKPCLLSYAQLRSDSPQFAELDRQFDLANCIRDQDRGSHRIYSYEALYAAQIRAGVLTSQDPRYCCTPCTILASETRRHTPTMASGDPVLLEIYILESAYIALLRRTWQYNNHQIS